MCFHICDLFSSAFSPMPFGCLSCAEQIKFQWFRVPSSIVQSCRSLCNPCVESVSYFFFFFFPSQSRCLKMYWFPIFTRFGAFYIDIDTFTWEWAGRNWGSSHNISVDQSRGLLHPPVNLLGHPIFFWKLQWRLLITRGTAYKSWNGPKFQYFSSWPKMLTLCTGTPRVRRIALIFEIAQKGICKWRKCEIRRILK